MRVLWLAFLASLMIGCSDSSEQVNAQDAGTSRFPAFPSLPTSPSESAQLTGAMSWWFFEGDGGCFGTLSDGRQRVELHAEADLCEAVEYEEGQEASIRVTFDPDKQYAPDNAKMYSITAFLQ